MENKNCCNIEYAINEYISFDQKQCAEALNAIVKEKDRAALVKQATEFLNSEVFCKKGTIAEMEVFVRGEFLDYLAPESEDKEVQKENKEIRRILNKHCTSQLRALQSRQDKERNAEDKQKIKEDKIKRQLQAIKERKAEIENNRNNSVIDIPKNVNKEIDEWENYVMPNGLDCTYEISDEGITLTAESFDKEGNPVEQTCEVSRTPFIISGKTDQLIDGSVFYTLRYRNNGKQKDVMVKKTDLQPLNKLKETLAKYDINVTDEMAKRAEEYVSKYIAVFGDSLYTMEAITANGWNADCTKFYCGNWAITEDGLKSIITTIDTDKLVVPFHRAGTLNGWCEAVTPVLEFNIARFMLYDGMSAPLRKVLDVHESQMTAISGDSSRGKTALAHLVGSTMGKPNNENGEIGLEFPVGTSSIPLITHAAGMSDMPVDFEEATGEIKAKLMIEAGYDIVNGSEKTRGQKDGKNRNDVKFMRVQAQITCERPLREYTNFAGLQYRINDIGGKIDLIPEGNGKLVKDLKTGIYANYGYFFPLYIQRIIEDKQRVKELYETALNNIDSELEGVPEESQCTAGRAKLSFALKIVAGYLCEELFDEIGVPAKTDKEVEDIVNYFFQKSVLGSPVKPDWKRALEYTSDILVSERSKFYTSGPNQNEIVKGECYGNLYDDRAEIIGTKLTEILKKGVFPTAVKKDWESMGIISKYGKISVGKKGELQQVNGYILSINKMNEYLNIEKDESLNEIELSSHDKLCKLADAIYFIRKNVSPEDIDLLFNGSLSDYTRITDKMIKPSTPNLSNAPLDKMDTEYVDNIQPKTKKEEVIKEQERQREEDRAKRQKIIEKKEHNKQKELEESRIIYQKKESGNNSVTA